MQFNTNYKTNSLNNEPSRIITNFDQINISNASSKKKGSHPPIQKYHLPATISSSGITPKPLIKHRENSSIVLNKASAEIKRVEDSSDESAEEATDISTRRKMLNTLLKTSSAGELKEYSEMFLAKVNTQNEMTEKKYFGGNNCPTSVESRIKTMNPLFTIKEKRYPAQEEQKELLVQSQNQQLLWQQEQLIQQQQQQILNLQNQLQYQYQQYQKLNYHYQLLNQQYQNITQMQPVPQQQQNHVWENKR